MGQKVSPHGLRVGIIKDWSSKWYANKQNFADYLAEDNKIRKYLKNTLKSAGISSINIERKGTEVKVNVATAKPGMIIGKGGSAIEELKKKLEKMTGKTVSLNIEEVKNIDMDATLVAESSAGQIARAEHYSEGTIPLQTLRADIDYGFAEALTTYGIIGVKVWIYKGDILPARKESKGGNK